MPDHHSCIKSIIEVNNFKDLLKICTVVFTNCNLFIVSIIVFLQSFFVGMTPLPPRYFVCLYIINDIISLM